MRGFEKLLYGGIFLLVFGALAWKFVSPTPLMQLSDGTMRATSAKLSYKGIIWKTWNGWIPVGVNSEGGAEKWHFTIKEGNEYVVDCINNNDKVKLHYKDYILMPFRFGNGHQVDSCEVINK